MKRTGLWMIGAIGILVVAAAVFAMKNPEANLVSIASPAPPLTLPAGTELSLRLGTTLSTKTTQVGDRFDAIVAEDVTFDGVTVVPEGTRVSGHVVVAQQPGKASGRGRLQLSYDEIHIDGKSQELATVSRVYESESGTKKDVAIIGGSAIGGAIAGKIIGGDSDDAAKGAAAGAAAGAGASLLTRGPQLEMPRGTLLTVRLDQPIEVPQPRDDRRS